MYGPIYLLYKLIKQGIIGKFYHLLKSMYSNIFYNVNTLKGFNERFKSNTGLKQGWFSLSVSK